MEFRILTYNIHKGIGGVDRSYRPERIIETVAHYDADIVLLQEVDDGVPRSRHHKQVDHVGDALGLPHRAFQRNVALREGWYGNAILSRFPLTHVRNIELTVPMKKRRRALAARCRLRFGERSRMLWLFNVHLGLAGYERHMQIGKLLADDGLQRAHPGTAVIAAGDFNDVWGRLGKRLLEPAGFHSASGRVKTFPAVLPMRPLDRIYFRGALEPRKCFASRMRVARQASDHLPLVAEFRFV